MAERLTRWQWARQHTRPGWREILAAFVAGTISLVLARHYGWDVSPTVGAIVAACLGAAVVWLGEFGWHFARSRIEQDRQELASLPPQREIVNAPRGFNLAAYESRALEARRDALKKEVAELQAEKDELSERRKPKDGG